MPMSGSNILIGKKMKHFLTILLSGKGLYAKRSFKKGEVVTVSPTILIEKDIISSMAESSSSVIQNYCMASHNSKMAFFPFGWGALANHAPKKQTNLVLDWHWWDSNNDYDKNEKMRKMSSSLSDLSTAPYAQLDLAYVADRDINAGEELTYYYGDEWTNAWSTHLARVVEWNIKNKLSQEVREVRRALSAFEVNNYEEEGHVHPNPTVEGVSDNQDVTEIPIPQFRHFIEIPDHLMIPEWRDLTLSQDYIGTNSVPYQDEIGEQKIEINVGVEDVDQGDLWNQKDIYLQNITLKDKMESSLNLDLSLHIDSVGQSSNCVSLDFESCLAQQTV